MRKVITILLGFIASASVYAQTNNIAVGIPGQAPDSAKVDTASFSGNTVAPAAPTTTVDDETVKLKVLNYVRSVYDKAVYVQNISTNIDLGLKGLGHNLTLDGKLQMRRNEVIRICITPFGLMEAARLEFTPKYVVFIDRIHKEYVKASYDNVSFLKAEGLDFYTLQSLFWNELFQPGKQKLGDDDLNNFTADISNPSAQCIRFKTPDILYRWNTDTLNQITYAGMTYNYKSKNYSTVMVNYGNFAPIGVKMFPKKLYIKFTSKVLSSGSLSLNMDMKDFSTNADWETETTVSSRYTQVSVDEFFKKIGTL